MLQCQIINYLQLLFFANYQLKKLLQIINDKGATVPQKRSTLKERPVDVLDSLLETHF